MPGSQGRSARIVLLGFGAINRRVAELLRARQSNAKVVGAIVRHPESFDLQGAVAVVTPSQLAALSPDVILEAATREAVREWGEAALSTAKRFIVSSSSAFADEQLLTHLRATARRHGSQLVLSTGALGGMDALSAAARLPLREVRHRIVKSPRSWGPAAADATSGSPAVLFKGPAREAATRYPLNANVTIVSALSGRGLDDTIVELICDPSASANRHEIHAAGDFGSLTITLENRPLQANPKSSELAALALVRLAENEVADLVL